MGKAFIHYLEEEKDLRERFVDWAHSEDKNIKDFSDFVEALKSAFNTSNGLKALKHLNDDESRLLFNSEENKRKMKENVSKEEFEELYDEETDFEIQRAVPKGQYTKISNIQAISVKKNIKKNTYRKKNNKVIKGYNSSYSKWNNNQVKFLQIRKAKKIRPKKIIFDFNQHFKDSQKSTDAIRTKLYRV